MSEGSLEMFLFHCDDKTQMLKVTKVRISVVKCITNMLYHIRYQASVDECSGGSKRKYNSKWATHAMPSYTAAIIQGH
jgi:hypothetical protein